MQTILTALRMLRVYLILAAAVFLGGALTGILLRELPEAMVQPLYELARELRDKPWFIMTLFLLCKNALAALVAILGGFLLGVLPFVAALTNGMVVGRVLADQPSAIALILPHGVFELPAVAIAWGAGLWCAGWLRRPPRAVRLRQRAATSLRLFVKLILPLLAVAAAIEATGIKWLTAS